MSMSRCAAAVVLALFVGAAARADEPRWAIYLHPAALAEAQSPCVDLADSGGGFWRPGPERLYGWALRDLRDYLRKMTKADYRFMPATADAGGGIFAGTFEEFTDHAPRASDPESFVIEVEGDRLFIVGNSTAGLIAAIYSFLDRLGCKWFAPGEAWENVPDLGAVPWDEGLKMASAGPSYRWRAFFSSFGLNSSVFEPGERDKEVALWNLRNRMGGTSYTANHHNQEILPASLFETRPELFALVQGKRIAQEIARANPETIELAIESAVQYLKENEGKGSYYNSFSVETGDGVPADEESLAKIGNHTPTDLNFWFANQVAEGIERAGLKDKWVGIYSYSDHGGIPSFDLHPRVGVMVTTGLDFSSNLSVEQRLDGLRERKAGRLGIYEYLNLVTWSLERPGWQPAARPLTVAENLKRWHQHGAMTYIAETSDSWVNSGPGHYLASRLLWDVESDPATELQAYYEGAYGPAASEIRLLFEDWEAPPPLSRGKLAQWHHWIRTADEKVKGQANYAARINAVKRYYLYLNLLREYEIDLAAAALPSKEDRWVRLMRFVGSQRGEGAFHARGLFLTHLLNAPQSGFQVERWGPEFKALATNAQDVEAWRAFPPISDAQIDAMFGDAALPLDGVRAAGQTWDPAVRVFPEDASPPAELRFPKLHGPPSVQRQYLLKVTAPTTLAFEVLADTALGGVEERTCVLRDVNDTEIHRVSFRIGAPVRFEIALEAGLYTATFAERGAEQVAVLGGNTFGAVRGWSDGWGFNPFRPAEKAEVAAYFLVPPGRTSLDVELVEGRVFIGLGDAPVGEVMGPAGGALTFAGSGEPRIGCVKWPGDIPTTTGMKIGGVTLWSPDPSYVLYETLD